MQIISTSLYNDLSIVNPSNGSTLLNGGKFYSYTQTFTTGLDSYILGLLTASPSVSLYMYTLNITVNKTNITDDICYYKLYDIIASNDPYTLISSNQHSNKDIITISFYNWSKNYNHFRMQFNLEPYDKNGNLLPATTYTAITEIIIYSI